MSIERVREYFRGVGIEDRIREFEVSSATVELAALALGCEGKRIAKTLSFYDGDGALLVVCAGDAKVSNAKFKAEFGMKPKMLGYDDVERLIGHAVGGVCPFGVKSCVRVYLDRSLSRFETVFPAAGSSNSAVEMTLPELSKYSCAIDTVDVCTGWEGEV